LIDRFLGTFEGAEMNAFLHWAAGWIIQFLGIAAMATAALAILLIALLPLSVLSGAPSIVEDGRFSMSVVLTAAFLLSFWITLERLYNVFLFHQLNKASMAIVRNSERILLREAAIDSGIAPEEYPIRFALYLRGFNRRRYFGYRWNFSPGRWRHILTAGQDFETDLFRTLMYWQIPMIKVGKDEGREVRIDGFSLSASDQEWRSMVARLAENAGVIFVTPARSAGLTAELMLILSSDDLIKKSSILFPPARDFLGANTEMAHALGFEADDLGFNVSLCDHKIVLVPATELFDCLRQAGLEFEDVPHDVAINQLPYRNVFCLGHLDRSETSRTLSDLLVFTANSVGEDGPMWIFAEARAEAERLMSKQSL
jgi:hypothetical protein